MKLHKCTSSEPYRDFLRHVYIDENNVVATNSHLLVAIPKKAIFEELELPNMFIKSDDWRKLVSKKVTYWKYESGFLISLDKGMKEIAIVRPLLEKKTGWTFPSYTNLIPKKKDIKKVDNIGVDLYNLEFAKAGLGVNRVNVCFYGKDRGMIITPANKEDSRFALVMPIMITE